VFGCTDACLLFGVVCCCLLLLLLLLLLLQQSRELVLNFFQSLVSQELAIGGQFGQFPPKLGEGTPDEAPYQNAHRKQIIVRIMASLQRVLRAKDIDLLSPRLREMYHVLLIAIVNNQDVSTFTPPGQEEGQYSCSFAWVVAKTDSVGSLLFFFSAFCCTLCSVLLCVLLYSVFSLFSAVRCGCFCCGQVVIQ